MGKTNKEIVDKGYRGGVDPITGKDSRVKLTRVQKAVDRTVRCFDREMAALDVGEYEEYTDGAQLVLDQAREYLDKLQAVLSLKKRHTGGEGLKGKWVG